MPPPPAPRPPAPCPASPVFSQRAPLLWMRAPHRVALAPQVHKGYMSKAEKVALLDDLAPHLQLVVKVLGSRAAELEGKGSKGGHETISLFCPFPHNRPVTELARLLMRIRALAAASPGWLKIKSTSRTGWHVALRGVNAAVDGAAPWVAAREKADAAKAVAKAAKAAKAAAKVGGANFSLQDGTTRDELTAMLERVPITQRLCPSCRRHSLVYVGDLNPADLEGKIKKVEAAHGVKLVAFMAKHPTGKDPTGVDKKPRLKLPAHLIARLVCAGPVHPSPQKGAQDGPARREQREQAAPSGARICPGARRWRPRRPRPTIRGGRIRSVSARVRATRCRPARRRKCAIKAFCV